MFNTTIRYYHTLQKITIGKINKLTKVILCNTINYKKGVDKNMEKTDNLVKSIRFPQDLKDKIQKSADKETRTFSAQVIHIIKKYYELQEKQ